MKMKALYTILLLTLSNTFMTFAWYGHLKFKDMEWGKNLPLLSIIVISWGIAFFEYLLQVPANRMGYKNNGGPFSLVELKVIQEVITLVVFASFSLVFFKTESFRWNHLVGFALLVGAVVLVPSLRYRAGIWATWKEANGGVAGVSPAEGVGRDSEAARTQGEASPCPARSQLASAYLSDTVPTWNGPPRNRARLSAT